MTRPLPRKGIERIKGHMVLSQTQWPPVSIFLNSNENALGPSSLVIKAAQSAASSLHRYVENQSRILVPEISKAFNINPSLITIGCGSDDLLARLARSYLVPGSELLRSENSYLKVPNYAYACDAFAIAAPDNDNAVDVDKMLESISNKTALVYIANPDNPSGSLLSVDSIRRLHAGIPSNTILIIDCAYAEYVDHDQHEELFAMVENNENIVVTRTFSKVYGLASARVGWIYAPQHIVDIVNRISLTFPLSVTSLNAALAALNDTHHIDYVVSYNREMRDKYTEKFGQLCTKIYPGQANFLLLKFQENSKKSAEKATEFLRTEGIAVRRFASPAYANCLRITLGFDSELQTTANALEQFMGS